MYQPKPFPPVSSIADLARHVDSELHAVAQAEHDLADSMQLTVLNAAPKKPRAGMIVCADGVHWQPLGAGGGYFGYFGGAWVKLNN
jgi:hypothetical protein